MAMSTMLGLMDDGAQAVLRLFGRQTSGEGAIDYKDPEQLVSALRNPATEATAVARMHKMHYGSFYNEKSRGMLSGFAEKELLTRGKGFGGAVFGRPVKGMSIGYSHLKGAVMFAPLQGIAEGAFAAKGHRMSGVAGGTAKAIAYGIGDAVGTSLAGPVAGLALGLMTEKLGGYIGEGVQMFNDYARSIKHVNMGGNYEDSRMAYTMRQRAAQEMGSSVMNARSWLGKEAILMHQ